MNKELIVRSSSDIVDFALLKDGKLIELHKDEEDNNFAVGDIFIAKIRKVMPGLNAAFVNVGYEKDGFLHYHDLGPQMPSLLKFIKRVSTGKLRDYTLKDFPMEKDLDKNGSIANAIKSNQSILVQVVKEPISTKGPRISSELSIAGRYIVLVPFSNRISISQKIDSQDEKDRLKRLVKSITPKGFGVIIRTVAEGKKVAELDSDLQSLLDRWTAMCKKLYKAHHPTKVLGEMNKASSILRDIFNDSFSGIVVDDEEMYVQVKDYVHQIAPNKESIVKYHKNGPIFEKFGIERQIKTSFGRTVSMSRGAYLVIEHTEALHVVDVNSGNRSNKEKNQEDTALEVNMISAQEIARQLRLRDMGGIIVIDFIDMGKAENRKKLFNYLRDEMKDDKAKHKILPPSKFGLVQITRQRVRPERNIKTKEENPNLVGGDEIEAPIKVVERINQDLERIFKKDYKKVTLNTHPFIAAFLTKGFPSVRSKWFFEHKKWVKVLPRDAYTYLEYHFFDKNGDKIK
ncbi:Rne/Rng family ribonuclease [Winogradskyella ludwigii]|jgi:ribonuclease G|uniref:Rne/Rng family ribonuclease n=1 Tax=Winogradskyella ludwigii TaxID=2686076 RepID=UPI0015C9B5E2|nr:ribonuclease E/G [Winogradskyella ludwigii]